VRDGTSNFQFRKFLGAKQSWIQSAVYSVAQMTFEDPELQALDARTPQSLYQLIVSGLCGESYYAPYDDARGMQIQNFLEVFREGGLDYAQFNELLLLVDQDRVTAPFFDFFFGKGVRVDQLTQKVIRFRGFAILCFGNFRYAYKQLSTCKSKEHLSRLLQPYAALEQQILEDFTNRPPVAFRIDRIPQEKTWCNGYIAKKKYEREARIIKDLLIAKRDPALVAQAEFYEELGRDIKQTENKALQNTDAYLTWDYMDVYVATSMRNSWEFEDTGTFVEELFRHAEIAPLKLRYFDPTQSQCANRIDKGLVEALMLKRARCTVYMVQETDTLGKDSELASTLAQGKPVIAFVPQIDVTKRAEKLEGFPLEFFKRRFQALQAEGIFDDDRVRNEISTNDLDQINAFLREYDAYRADQPLSLWKNKDDEFKRKSTQFKRITQLLAIVERASFDKRASTLRDVHPLSLQVHLESGVANGVLVVRSADECARVLRQLLLNELSFTFGIIQDKKNPADKGVTVLLEKISKSPFRAVTRYEKLANSFWNFYLVPEHLKG